MQAIQMHLWEKQKTFSEFFYAFLKSTSNFENFQENMYFQNYGLQRTWLDKCLKSPV